MARIRKKSERDVEMLPRIERSAGEAFRAIPDLAWVADDDVQSAEAHRLASKVGWSWVVVDEADRPFGFLTAERFDAELHIWALAVERARQGQGAGRALLDASIAHARDRKLTAVTLTTFRAVPWNEPLYAHFGFRTLAPDALGPRLFHILEREEAHGLPGHRRCAMRLDLLPGKSLHSGKKATAKRPLITLPPAL
ncbi:GNAT family N-acetyltransferase [Sphingosinicella sp. CPCC 101087]|uniref:GNAT family N-acetyltransferase n=1 Tax=Sphingosinicella sp. CPCC 101087 TaxID=2497754 RepID=UPI00197FB68C|nr:GNAT family N-acetyltransferase [Sphingosinicella sp. CPCC 101087]